MVISDVAPRHKRPFLRYLLWVYMNIGGNEIDTGSIILHHDRWQIIHFNIKKINKLYILCIHRQMWSFLEHISLLLEGVVKALKGLPLDQVLEAKYQLTTQTLRIKHGSVTKAVTVAKNIPFVSDEKGEIVPGLLLYIMEGILPMLKVNKSRS